jgi:cytochrome d ubiquinol oxidase subunit I
MSDLLAARSQMALSLGFHILFAVAGIAMPLMMVMAEWRHARTGDASALELAKRWAKGTAILFAVGAVSGTVLSFELGLLWPGFMKFAGAIVGMPFSLEGFAFFTEAIFLGIYLYGWDRVSRGAHIAAGVIVALSGALSALFVVIANAWMNVPRGFSVANGVPADIDPFAAMATPAAPAQVVHMLLAAYAAVGFIVAGIHARALLRDPNSAFNRHALRIALLVGAPAALLQPIAGDYAARVVARYQPAKLAAMEGHFETRRGAPLHVGGWPDVERRETRWSIEIPRGLSLLAFHDPDAEVQGLDRVPREDWPPVPVVHVAFQIMVACGTLMAAVALWAGWVAFRKREIATNRALLRAILVTSPLGLLAIEAGWTVTEVGRQPWVIYGVMRTAEAVTPMPALVIPFATITLLYLLLGLIVLRLLQRHVAAAHAEGVA